MKLAPGSTFGISVRCGEVRYADGYHTWHRSIGAHTYAFHAYPALPGTFPGTGVIRFPWKVEVSRLVRGHGWVTVHNFTA